MSVSCHDLYESEPRQNHALANRSNAEHYQGITLDDTKLALDVLHMSDRSYHKGDVDSVTDHLIF